MIPNCLDYASQQHAAGRPVVGILCEFTPREIILAAGAVPVCLCGGSRETISAAEEVLPSNLCPLIKSTFGYAVTRSNPFLEMADLIVGETTCDGKKKMFELLAERKAMHVLELPQKPDEPGARDHWRAELDRFKTALEERFGVIVSDERLRAASAAMNRERGVRRELAALMERPAPPLTGRQLLDLKTSISCIPGAQEALEGALACLKEAPGLPGVEARTRVLLTGVPTVSGAEKVVAILEDCGGLVVAQENCTGLKPILEDVALDGPDILDAIAAKYLHLPCSVMTPNRGRLDSLRELAARTRPHCVVDLVWQACLTYDVESYRVKRFVEEELHLPYLKIETDYSPSDSQRIAVRVEALYEIARGTARR
jgi:benzoyl-CoA reductase/2-hydroxyglutaryl-CoA dehydratase subunit BcrC/BadD/HgdB